MHQYYQEWDDRASPSGAFPYYFYSQYPQARYFGLTDVLRPFSDLPQDCWSQVAKFAAPYILAGDMGGLYAYLLFVYRRLDEFACAGTPANFDLPMLWKHWNTCLSKETRDLLFEGKQQNYVMEMLRGREEIYRHLLMNNVSSRPLSRHAQTFFERHEKGLEVAMSKKTILFKNRAGQASLAALAAQKEAAHAAKMQHKVVDMAAYHQEQGHLCVSAVLRLPRECHPGYQTTVNPLWVAADCSNPREADAELKERWRLITEACRSAGARVMGMAFPDAHLSGTPHLHCNVYFKNAADLAEFKKQANRLFPVEAGGGAFIKVLDESEVMATALYNAKNIMPRSPETHDEEEIERHTQVRAWARFWGIRLSSSLGHQPDKYWDAINKLDLSPLRDPALVASIPVAALEVLKAAAGFDLADGKIVQAPRSYRRYLELTEGDSPAVVLSQLDLSSGALLKLGEACSIRVSPEQLQVLESENQNLYAGAGAGAVHPGSFRLHLSIDYKRPLKILRSKAVLAHFGAVLDPPDPPPPTRRYFDWVGKRKKQPSAAIQLPRIVQPSPQAAPAASTRKVFTAEEAWNPAPAPAVALPVLPGLERAYWTRTREKRRKRRC